MEGEGVEAGRGAIPQSPGWGRGGTTFPRPQIWMPKPLPPSRPRPAVPAAITGTPCSPTLPPDLLPSHLSSKCLRFTA